MNKRSFLVFALLAAASVGYTAEHNVITVADIARLSPQAKPGDVLIMRDGVWRDAAIVFDALGTAERPITLRAATPGQAVLVGQSFVKIEGEHLVVSGL